MQYMNITQGVNGEYSHQGTLAIDCAGKDRNIDNAYAPFDGVVKKIYTIGNTVWLESLEPVQYADGTVDYATVNLTHDNAVLDLKVGQVIKQGQVFYQEGTAGNATGNHIHLEIGRGKFRAPGWYQNAQGVWMINNAYLPYNAFFLGDTIIINSGGYNWVKGDTEVIIGNGDNWYYRFNRLHHQLVRNGDMSREVFNNIVGGDAWKVVESWSDHPEADQLIQDQQLGELARKDGWRDQIVNGQDEIIKLKTALAEKPKEVIVEKPVEVIKEVIKEVPVEVIKEVVKGDDERTFGDLITSAFKKLFRIK